MTTALNPDEHMLLIDLETTGLDPRDDLILEVGCMIVTLDFKVIDSYEAVIDPGHEIDWESVNPFVKDMHTNNGLRKQIDAGLGSDLEAVDMTLVEWYRGHFADGKTPLVGSSVGFDRGFVNAHLTRFSEVPHYRNIDFSSVKELCRRYNPEVYAKLPAKREVHRAIPDLYDTINEARFYVENFLFETVGV